MAKLPKVLSLCKATRSQLNLYIYLPRQRIMRMANPSSRLLFALPCASLFLNPPHHRHLPHPGVSVAMDLSSLPRVHFAWRFVLAAHASLPRCGRWAWMLGRLIRRLGDSLRRPQPWCTSTSLSRLTLTPSSASCRTPCSSTCISAPHPGHVRARGLCLSYVSEQLYSERCFAVPPTTAVRLLRPLWSAGLARLLLYLFALVVI